MLINVRDIELRPLRFEREFQIGEIDFLDPKLRQTSALKVEGRADFSEALSEIRLSGHLRVDMESDCDRCLEPTRVPIETDFRLCYQPAEANVGPEEAMLKDDEANVGFYENDSLDLNDVLREQVLLAMPMRRVCGEDCKGLCPTCGENWNTGDCDCEPVESFDRWGKLREWKSAN